MAMDKATVDYLWKYLEEGIFFLSDIGPLARDYGYYKGDYDDEYAQMNPPGYWDRNAVFALLILAAEGEL